MRFMTGIVAGAILGTAASMMVMPRMDHRTRRMVTRAGRKMQHTAGEAIVGLIDYLR